MAPNLPETIDHLRIVLDHSQFDECVTTGAAIKLAQAVQRAHDHIQLTRPQLDDRPTGARTSLPSGDRCRSGDDSGRE